MQHRVFWLAVLFITTDSFAQKKIVESANQLILRNETEAHLTFLAADEMRGRDVGTPEIDIAANYIRAQFKRLGLDSAPGAENYFQVVKMVKSFPAVNANVVVGKERFRLKDNLLVMGGESLEWSGDFLFVGYGSPEELAQHDVKGKMILALAGSKETQNINRAISESQVKYDYVTRQGAAGLVEVLTIPYTPWHVLFNALHKEHWTIAGTETKKPPFIWVKPPNVKTFINQLTTASGSVSVEMPPSKVVDGKNVAAIIEGTDDTLKEEFVIVTAHYDHIGVGKPRHNEDSIYNGARDNAIGTVALLQTAEFLSHNPPKRSVILLAVTGEEKGKLGSKWYADHPLVPLHQHVLNVNCDGVGFNDKTLVTSISLGRTNTDPVLQEAAKAFGFRLGGDPDPREGFYERSDQLSFARKGIPAIKLQPGLARMDSEILRYYHRVTDEVSSIDLNYVNQFYKTFVYSIYLLTHHSQLPAWNTGDPYEGVSQKLRQQN